MATDNRKSFGPVTKLNHWFLFSASVDAKTSFIFLTLFRPGGEGGGGGGRGNSARSDFGG